MAFEALIAARNTITEQAFKVWQDGGDYEAVIDKLCNDWNVEPYLVRDHLTEVIRANHLKRQLVRIDN